MKNITFLVFVLVLAMSCSNANKNTMNEPPIQHIVILWLHEPGNPEQRHKLIDAAEVLKEIPGVITVSAGEPLPSDRAIVDDSFDVAYIFTFENQESMRHYLTHDDHKEVVASLIKPLVAKMLVYDFQDALPVNGFNEKLKNH